MNESEDKFTRITVKELAQRLGLARSTVTMALNDSPRVKPATRVRVKNAAREMNYVPNRVASAMKQGCTNTIGLIMGQSPTEYIFKMLIGATESFSKHDYNITVIRLTKDLNADAIAKQCASLCLAGVLVVNITPEDISELKRKLDGWRIPMISMLLHCDDPEVYNVYSDDKVGIEEAIDHLHRLGHKTIGFVGGGSSWAAVKHRRQAFEEVMHDHGLECDPYNVRECDFDRMEIIHTVKNLVLQRNGRPTAILCSNDQTACIAIAVANSVGIRVPDELSIIGFSNLRMAEYSDPPLTSIAQDFEQIGSESANLMLSVLQASGGTTEARDGTRKIHVPSRLKLRETTSLAKEESITITNKTLRN